MCLPTKTTLSMDNIDIVTGQPRLPPPPLPPTLLKRCIRYVIMYVLVPMLFPILIFKLVVQRNWTELWDLFHLVWKAGQDPIKDHTEYYQNPKLLQQLYKEEKSAKVYVEQNAFEWQHMEGFCGPATLRCVLASFGIPLESLPPQVRSPMGPEKFIQRLEDTMISPSSSTNEEKELSTTSNNKKTDKDHSLSKITSEIVRGDCSYEIFLQTIRRIVSNENERIVINFLRPALFGPPRPMTWLPTHILIGLFGGHFSPIIGVIEREEDTMNPLVAVFDVNHKYGGTYFVPARQLYQSVQATDAESGKSRALIVLTKNKKTD